jgi:hypothetical protein
VAATTIDGAEELAAPLDLLLTSSAVGVAQRILPNTSWNRFVLNLGRQPRTVTARAAELGRELLSIAEGRSDIAPAKGDDRFADPGWAHDTGVDLARTNVNGGAITMGHPLGASGARIMTTLVNALEKRGGRYGLHTMCEGGGMANVTIIERL